MASNTDDFDQGVLELHRHRPRRKVTPKQRAAQSRLAVAGLLAGQFNGAYRLTDKGRKLIGAPPPVRQHTKVSNGTFTRMSGVRWVCMDCGQTNLNAEKVCPGE